MTDLALYSASQITKFHDECKRAWGWRYIAGIKTPQKASAALGTEIDDTQLQPFLRDGRSIDFSRPSGEIAASALEFLPAPKSNALEVQKHFVIPSPTWRDADTHCGVGLQGFVDLWLPKGGIPLPEDVPRTVDGVVPPVVADFKSTVDIGKWSKTTTQLSTDVQAQLYAFWAMYATRKPVVDLVWIYMQTRGPRKALRRHLRVFAPDVAKQFLSINERALQIHEAKCTVADPLQLEPNTDHCDAYGGCPYQSNCNLGPGDIADARAAKARREREAKMSTTPTAPTNGLGLLARMRAQRESQGVNTAPAAASAAPAAVEAPVQPLGINPPESKLPPAPLDTVIPDPPPAAAAAAAAPVTVAETPKRGPGRPRKTPAPAAAPTAAPVAVPVPVESPEAPSISNFASAIKTSLEDAFDPSTRTTFGERVRVVWAKEKIQPLAYNDFEIGPFEAEGFTRPGESIVAASDRIYAELTAFAEKVRAQKAESFAKLLSQTGIVQ